MGGRSKGVREGGREGGSELSAFSGKNINYV